MNRDISISDIAVGTLVLAAFIISGLFITSYIRDSISDSNQMFIRALKTDSQEEFDYYLSTNAGDTLAYGTLDAVDPVTWEDLDDSYLYVQRIKEVYTRHTREVTKKDSNGKEYTEEETYYSWDEVDREDKKSSMMFMGHEFSSENAIRFIPMYISTKEEVFSDTRYKYYGVPKSFNCTLLCTLDGGINVKTFYKDKDIEGVLKSEIDDANVIVIIFWFFWAFLFILIIVMCKREGVIP